MRRDAVALDPPGLGDQDEDALPPSQDPRGTRQVQHTGHSCQ